MEKKTKEAGNNLMELKEEKAEQNEKNNISQTQKKNLRNTKKVNYSQFFSEDQDNSEEYETPEEIKQKIELNKKRKRSKPVKKTNPDNDTEKKKKTKKEKNDVEKNKENKNNEEEKKNKSDMQVEEEKNKEKEGEAADKKNKNNNLGSIINISDTLSKYNDNDNIPNSELILIILELCLNSSQLGIEKDNSSRAFWEEIGKKTELKKITNKFKPETLRKYWRTIRETKKFKKIISETKRYKNELNNQNMKLFASIHAVCEYVSNPGRKMDYYLNKHMTKSVNKSKKDNVNNKTPNEQIEEIVNTFMKYFPKKDEKEILSILFKNNFDIEKTFFVLKDEENFENLGFNEKEDEIIRKNFEDKDDKNEEYQKLVYTKGLEEVLRRKEFLFNIKIDRSQFKVKNDKEKDEDGMMVEIDDKENDKKEKENDANKDENKKGEEKKDNVKEEKEDKVNNQKKENEK
jgi:DnaJ family protein A protein 5